MDLPQQYILVTNIYFDKDDTVNWYFIDGSKMKVTYFKYMPKRNIGDQFMNTSNNIATIALAYTKNVTLGDKACFM